MDGVEVPLLNFKHFHSSTSITSRSIFPTTPQLEHHTTCNMLRSLSRSAARGLSTVNRASNLVRSPQVVAR